jgi:5-methylcytosine-specific restriction endonuclease McrA
MSYGDVIKWNVNRKWKTVELKEWWYTKLTQSRRRKLTRLFEQQSGECIYCQCKTWMAVPDVQLQKPPEGFTHRQMATADHVIPQMRGGTDRATNLVLACKDCNNRRATMEFQAFLDIRSDPVKWAAYNLKRAQTTSENGEAHKAKSQLRRKKLVFNIAIIFYLNSHFG